MACVGAMVSSGRDRSLDPAHLPDRTASARDGDRIAQEDLPVADVSRDEHPLGFMRTGIGAIDAEHLEIITFYRQLVLALELGSDVTAFALSLHSLIHRVQKHFTAEERFMREIGFDGYDRHKREHERLARNALDMLDRVACCFEKYDCMAVARYFRCWLVKHITEYDMEIARFVATMDASHRHHGR